MTSIITYKKTRRVVEHEGEKIIEEKTEFRVRGKVKISIQVITIAIVVREIIMMIIK